MPLGHRIFIPAWYAMMTSQSIETGSEPSHVQPSASRSLLPAVTILGVIALLCIGSRLAYAAEEERAIAGNQVAVTSAQPVDTPAVPQVETAKLRAGYPRNHEMWRYCPPDNAHPCVDLDIPGVTLPETVPEPENPPK